MPGKFLKKFQGEFMTKKKSSGDTSPETVGGIYCEN